MVLDGTSEISTEVGSNDGFSVVIVDGDPLTVAMLGSDEGNGG